MTGIGFQYVAGAAEITFDDTATGAFAQPIYSGSTITSSTVNVGLDWLASFGTTLNSYSFETYIHEIGHALGLAHGGNYNGSAVYGVDNYYLNDSLAWSIMSYMQAFNDEFDFGQPGDVNNYVNASFRYIYTPQIADIIAIQYLYGDNSSAFTGNTTYGYNSNTGVAAIDGAVNSGALMAMTVYDDGGTDTLDFSGYGSFQVISLIEESLSSVLGGTYNLGIARGTVIENAIGGSGDDDIYGNGAANTLQGRNGADYLYGGGGTDVLIGGAGADLLDGGTGTDTASYTTASAAVRVDLLTPASNTGEAAGDTFFLIEVLAGSSFNDTLGGDNLVNTLYGNSGNDALDGRGSLDYLFGGDGNDTLVGGAGGDYHDGGTGTRDLASYWTAATGLRAVLLAPAGNTGDAAGDSYVGIEDLGGTGFSDVLGGDNGRTRSSAAMATTISTASAAMTRFTAAMAMTG